MIRKHARRVLRAALGFFVVLLGIVLARTASVRSRQPAASVARPSGSEDAPVDARAVAEHLAGAIVTRTVSTSTEAPAEGAELDALRAHVERTFPRVHRALAREVIGEHALLYTWRAEGNEAPIVFCAHQDVVPVEQGTETAWKAPPFEGRIEDGFVWGRGTLDDKGSLIALLESVEALLGEGFVPSRTVYLAFGHDEEISGQRGAAKIVEALSTRGVRAEAVLDEGNPIVHGVVPSIAGPVAPIGIAEKGYLTVKLSVDMPGGHTATPAAESALMVLGRALERVAARPMPARLDGATRQFFEWAAPEMSFGQRMVLANTWLTWPLVARLFARSPALDASIRTTTAPTTFHAGVKDNVIPRTAEAQVNFRVLPGDTTEGVVAHVRAAVDDARVRVDPDASSRQEPTKVSRSDSRAFTAIATAVRDVFPDAVVAPALVLGATDGRRYEAVADDVYRFLPVAIGPDDLHRVHGTDERIAVSSLADAVRFYRRLIRLLAAPR